MFVRKPSGFHCENLFLYTNCRSFSPSQKKRRKNMFCQNHPYTEEKNEHSECDVDILCAHLTGKNMFPAKIKSYNIRGMYCESCEFMEKGTMIYYKIENILKWIYDKKARGGVRTVSLAEVESCREIGTDTGNLRYGATVTYYNRHTVQ